MTINGKSNRPRVTLFPRKQSVFRKLGYLLSAYWLREGLNALFLVLLARSGTENYGEFLLALNLGYMVRFASEFGLNQHLATLLARGGQARRDTLRQVTYIKIGLLLASLSVLACFVFWQGYSPRLTVLCLIIAPSVGLEALANSFFISCQVLGRQDVEGRVRGAAGVLGYGWGLVCLLLSQPALIVGLFKPLDTGVTIITAFRTMFRGAASLRPRTPLRDLWAVWREGVIFTLMAFAAITYNKINMFFLQRYAGSDGVAQYGATWQIVDGVSVLVSGMLLGRVLFPVFVRQYARSREKFLGLARTSAKWLVAASMPVMFILWVESDHIIGLIYGDGYGQSVWLQHWLVPCVGFAYLHNLSAYLMISMKRQRLLLVIYLLGLVFNVLFCLFVIPDEPLRGTAMAITATKGFVCFMTAGYCQWHLRFLRLGDMAKLGVTIAIGMGLNRVGSELGFRPLGEALALAPLLWLCWCWKRQHDAGVRLSEVGVSNS